MDTVDDVKDDNSQPSDTTCSNTDEEDEHDDVHFQVEGTRRRKLPSFQITSPTTPSTSTPSTITHVDYSYSWGKTKIHTGPDTTNNNINNNNNKNKKKQLTDSHTSYRRLLEQNAVTLKLQLAESQAHADTLQNDLNLATKRALAAMEALQALEIQHAESVRLAEGLGTVVQHMQSNAKDCAGERSGLYRKMDEYEREREIMGRRAKQFRFENRRLKKDVEEGRREMEGKRMEIQGLKSENEWFKNERARDNAKKETDVFTDDGGLVAVRMLEALPVIAEIREFLTPSTRQKQIANRTINADGSTEPHGPIGPDTTLPTPDTNPPLTTDDDIATNPKMNLALSYESRYTSFSDIHLSNNSDSNAVDTSAKEDDDDPTASSGAGKKKTDGRRIRRQTSTGARHFFNQLVAKHVQGSNDDTDNESLGARNVRRRTRQRPEEHYPTSTEGDAVGMGRVEDRTTDTPIRDRAQRWQAAMGSTPSRSSSMGQTNGEADAPPATSKWNWWWKNEDEDVDPMPDPLPDPPPQPQQTSSSWLFPGGGNECRPPLSLHHDGGGEAPSGSVNGGMASGNVTDNAIRSLDSPTFGFNNTLVPRRMDDNPVFT